MIREPPNNPREAREWTAPVFEFDMAVQQMHRDYKVVAFYADPTGWEAHVVAVGGTVWAQVQDQGGRGRQAPDHVVAEWQRRRRSPMSIKRLKASILASGQARTAAVTSAHGRQGGDEGGGGVHLLRQLRN